MTWSILGQWTLFHDKTMSRLTCSILVEDHNFVVMHGRHSDLKLANGRSSDGRCGAERKEYVRKHVGKGVLVVKMSL